MRSENDSWVSHNLQRQRDLLEKQRQRRLQASLSSSISSTNRQQNIWNIEQNKNQNDSQVGSQNFAFSSSSTQSQNSIDRPTQSRGSLYSFMSTPSPNPNSANPFGSSFGSVSTMVTGNTEPKIITVKGITPPQSRKQSYEGAQHDQQLNRVLKTPVLNVDHLEPVSSSFCCSENEDEDKDPEELPPSDFGFRGLNIRQNVNQLSPSSTTALASKRPSWNEDDDASEIPTEILNEEPLETLDISDNLEQFVMDPVRKNFTLKCRITRDKRGMDKGMYPIYYLHLEKNDGRRTFLLAARKRKKSTTANYLISVDPTDLRRNGRSFVAKVRSNAMGTMFTIYDNGESPKKNGAIGDAVRRELAAVIYETNVLGLKGPRKMTIIIPGIYVDQKHNYVRPLAVRPISEKDSIMERYKTNRLDEMVVLNNKQPVWNEDTQSYVLNFHGRVTQASVKNFQIVHSMQAQSFDGQRRSSMSPDPNEYVIMQFGRIDNESFTMDVRYPLSAVQAFGIAMTSFHGKLACE